MGKLDELMLDVYKRYENGEKVNRRMGLMLDDLADAIADRVVQKMESRRRGAGGDFPDIFGAFNNNGR